MVMLSRSELFLPYKTLLGQDKCYLLATNPKKTGTIEKMCISRESQTPRGSIKYTKKL